MRRHKGPQSGQALLLVTFALVAMCGLMGLAVDLGWSYFVKKSAQTAADAAALAAINNARMRNPSGPPYACGTSSTSLFCNHSPVPCGSISSDSNLYSACQYARQMGFVDGSGNVRVTVASDITTPAPTAPGVQVAYWVTVRVTQQIPQLFSSVLGNATGAVTARATAAITNVALSASLDLLNRQNDPGPNGTGIDFNLQGGGNVQAGGGMFIASNIPGAATLGGSSTVSNTQFTDIRGDGTCMVGSGRGCTSTQWSNPWTNGYADGPQFWDPTAGKPQPPIVNPPAQEWPIRDGNLTPGNACIRNSCAVTGSGTQNDPYTLVPGKYYAVDSIGRATGAQLTFNGSFTTFSNNGAGFGSFVFFGGLQTGASNQTITFTPGQYVVAGTTAGLPSIMLDHGTVIRDQTVAGNTQVDPGEMFIFTDVPNPLGGYAGYPGLAGIVPAAVSALGPGALSYGQAGFSFKSGNNNNSGVTLHGLNDASSMLPPALGGYTPYLLWQDRGNSHVAYDAQGNIITTGLGCVTEAPGVASIDNPCVNSRVPANSGSPQMNLWATPTTNLFGAVYQPRGAWVNFQGGGSIGPLQIVTGAFMLGGTPTVPLMGVNNPIRVPTSALIE